LLKGTASAVPKQLPLQCGFRLWGAAPAPFDIYYDDIALDTRRLGPIN